MDMFNSDYLSVFGRMGIQRVSLVCNLPILMGVIVFIVMNFLMYVKAKCHGESAGRDVIDLARQEGKLL